MHPLPRLRKASHLQPARVEAKASLSLGIVPIRTIRERGRTTPGTAAVTLTNLIRVARLVLVLVLVLVTENATHVAVRKRSLGRVRRKSGRKQKPTALNSALSVATPKMRGTMPGKMHPRKNSTKSRKGPRVGLEISKRRQKDRLITN